MTEEERIAHYNKLQWAAQQTQRPVYPAYAELGALPVAPDRGKEPWAELRLTWVAGRLSGFESWIKGEAFWRGLEIQIDVDKGWIQNQYRIKFDGPRTKITEMEKFLLAILDNGKAEK